MNAVLEKAKSIGQSALTKLVSPLLEKPKSKVTWPAYGKWRTLSHNRSNGKVTLRRSKQQPRDAKVVKTSREARDYALATWALEVDSRGRFPAAPPPLPARQPIFRQTDYRLTAYRPLGKPKLMRITPKRPRLVR